VADSERSIAKEELVKLLASALGQEKSEEVVLSTARSLGYAGPYYSANEVRGLFVQLSKTEGLIGVVARFAVSRGDVEALVEKAQSTRNPRVSAKPGVSDPPSSKSRIAVVDLLPLLSPALGTEKARDATTATAVRLGFDARSLSRDEALAVLDDLARSEGIIGVVARFEKARFLLEMGN
jgi:hypothetical protein